MYKCFMNTVMLISFMSAGSTSAVNAQRQAAESNALPMKVSLSDTDKEILKLRIKHLSKLDQQFRGYLSWETLDDGEIERISKLEGLEMIQAMKANKGKLNRETIQLLEKLQKKNDLQILKEFEEIVKEYGYPSPDRLGVESDDLFVVLLHPPLELDQIEAHLKKMEALLLPEVKSGRMKPKFYAMFVDNMLGKILRRPQLYGTNEVFNPQTKKIDPPIIGDLNTTNKARREIGLPELKKGEYRIAETKKAEN